MHKYSQKTTQQYEKAQKSRLCIKKANILVFDPGTSTVPQLENTSFIDLY